MYKLILIMSLYGRTASTELVEEKLTLQDCKKKAAQSNAIIAGATTPPVSYRYTCTKQ